MKKRHIANAALVRLGAARLLNSYWGPERLTVLNYHRIADVNSPDFDYYPANVSATPAMFDRQMAYVAAHFNVIDLPQLQRFITQGEPLPAHPLLITFDDGYLDNYIHAVPVLRHYGLPAVIFLLTGAIDNPTPPWWDACAYCFHHTTKTQADLPLLGPSDLSTPEQRSAIRETMIRRLKTLPDEQKQQALQDLQTALAVTVPDSDPNLFMNWEHVREIAEYGIAGQPHTVTHPILTRIDPARMKQEIAQSCQAIVQQGQQEVLAFAYPNGTLHDYDQTALDTLRELDVSMAFTLTPGPMRAAEVRRHPLEIQRIFLGHRDSFEIFVMKTMGLPAVYTRPAFVERGTAR
ncbi:polysaccharide deacetylase family protein [Chloroflexota bacterium]